MMDKELLAARHGSRHMIKVILTGKIAMDTEMNLYLLKMNLKLLYFLQVDY